MTPSETPTPFPTTDIQVYGGEGELLTYLRGMDELREQCPVARATEGDGYWVLTRMEDIREAMQTPEIFSNQVGHVLDPDPGVVRIPEMLDPPEHTKWRQLLAPIFAPGQIRKLEETVRSRAVELIEPMVSVGSCDFTTEFAQTYPTSIFLELMGLPLGDRPMFLEWEHDILSVSGDEDPERLRARSAIEEVTSYFDEILNERRKSPKDDLMSAAISWQVDGKPTTQDDLLSLCLLLFMAGLDTVTQQLNWSFWHLATNPEDRERVASDPTVIDAAVEEFLRVYTIVRPARRVLQDTAVAGCPMKKGDILLLPLNAASRDPRSFPAGDKVILDRGPTDHIAFGAGPHRCVGSHLARRELKVALEEWHKRIPNYSVPEDVTVKENGAAQLEIVSLSLQW
jgi:cytochrome P450